ncbi:hypothetical protein KIPB_011523, partial [Kipferlia bialata]
EFCTLVRDRYIGEVGEGDELRLVAASPPPRSEDTYAPYVAWYKMAEGEGTPGYRRGKELMEGMLTELGIQIEEGDESCCAGGDVGGTPRVSGGRESGEGERDGERPKTGCVCPPVEYHPHPIPHTHAPSLRVPLQRPRAVRSSARGIMPNPVPNPNSPNSPHSTDSGTCPSPSALSLGVAERESVKREIKVKLGVCVKAEAQLQQGVDFLKEAVRLL